MHFLSHYYIDRRQSSPEFAVGALLPDLIPGFTRFFNRKIKNYDTRNRPEGLRQLHLGVLRHFEADKLFHQKVVFDELVQLLQQKMLEQLLDRSVFRTSFLAHIGVEAMLDRVLVLENEAVTKEYYERLMAADMEVIRRYFSETLPDSVESEFFHRFRIFCEGRFLFRLKTVEGLTEGLCHTYQRVTGTAITGNDREKLIRSLNNIEQNVRYSSQSLLAL